MVDSRFDPAFQRGFSGSVRPPEETPAPPTVYADRAGTPQTWGHPPQDFQDIQDFEFAMPPIRRRNPWVLSLWIVGGVTFVLGMLGIFAQSLRYVSNGYFDQAYPDTPNPWDPLIQMLTLLAFPFLVTGLLALLIGLAVSAIRFDLRHQESAPRFGSAERG
ncbi:hypothetical protein [Mycetocola saprophilus]|uniref:hypothetical protein n=1 Tax=Mycetocola saprophilus TaxID=76636 RepID=UPI0004BE9524|nr:hypothetical protein [Mycetocola saprophilus]